MTSSFFLALPSFALLLLNAYFFDSARSDSSRNFFAGCRRQRWKVIWKANFVLRRRCQEKLIPFNTFCFASLYHKKEGEKTFNPQLLKNFVQHISSKQTPISSKPTSYFNTTQKILRLTETDKNLTSWLTWGLVRVYIVPDLCFTWLTSTHRVITSLSNINNCYCVKKLLDKEPEHLCCNENTEETERWISFCWHSELLSI